MVVHFRHVPHGNLPVTLATPDRYRVDVDKKIRARLRGLGRPTRPPVFTGYSPGDVVDASLWDQCDRRGLVRPVTVDRVNTGHTCESHVLVTVVDATGRRVSLDAGWVRPVPLRTPVL